eukprot:6176533-Pleurochrysis_carterae.AAC.1
MAPTKAIDEAQAAVRSFTTRPLHKFERNKRPVAGMHLLAGTDSEHLKIARPVSRRHTEDALGGSAAGRADRITSLAELVLCNIRVIPRWRATGH